MGSSVFRLRSNEDYSHPVQMGRSVSVQSPGERRRYIRETDEHETEWTATYNVDGRTCTLMCLKIVGAGGGSTGSNDGGDDFEKLSICIHDCASEPSDEALFVLHQLRTKDGRLIICDENYGMLNYGQVVSDRKIPIGRGGGITHTTVYSYGLHKRSGLVVLERKMRSNSDPTCCSITVAHYFVIIATNPDDDIGLSTSRQRAGGQPEIRSSIHNRESAYLGNGNSSVYYMHQNNYYQSAS